MASKKEAVIRFRADTTEFTQGITQINKSLSNLRSDLKLSNAEIKANGESVEGLSNKSKTLKNAIEQNANKINLLEKKLASCKETLGENSDEYSRLYKQLNNAKAEQAKFQSELKQTESALEKVGNEAKEAGNKVDKFGDEAKELSGLQKVVDDLKGSFESLGDNIGGITLGNLISDGIQSAISAVTDSIKDFMGYLSELPQATEEFRQGLARVETVASTNGKNVQGMTDTYKELNKYFQDENGVGNMVANLGKLDVSEKTLQDTTNGIIGAFAEFGDGLDKEGLAEDINLTTKMSEVQGVLKDAFERTGIDCETFNKQLQGAKTEEERLQLINDQLNGSFGDSKTAYDEAYASQLQFNEATGDTLETESQLADAILPVQTAWENMKGTLLDAVAPAIQTVCDWIQKAIDWCKQFSESPTWEALKTVASVVLKPLADSFTLVWEGIKIVWDVFKMLWQVIQPVWNLLMEGITSVLQPLANNWGKLAEATGQAWTSIKGYIQTAVNAISTWVSNFCTNVKNYVTNAWNNIKTWTVNTWNSVKQTISDKFNQAKQTVVDAIERMKSAFSGVKEAVSGAFSSVYSAITTPFKNAYNTALQWYNKIVGLLNKLPGVNIKGATAYKAFSGGSGGHASEHATGGIFTRPTLMRSNLGFNHIVGEAGAEAILPLNGFYNHLDSTLAMNMAYNNDAIVNELRELRSDVNKLNLTLDIDGMKVAEAIARSSEEVSHTRQTLYERGVNI